MVRLERDPGRRGELWRGCDIFRAAVSEQVVGEDSIDWLAQRMQELLREGLIAHGPVSGGVREPPVWDGNWIQSVHGWRVTASGRADAALIQPPNRTTGLDVATIRERKIERLREGMNARMRLYQQGEKMSPDEFRPVVASWASNLGVTIRALTDEYQEGVFLAVTGDRLGPRAELLAKIAYVDDILIEKISAGRYDTWSSSLD